MITGRLAIQSWMMWGVAASLPFLIGRNPFTMLVALCGVVAVNRSWRATSSTAHGWSFALKLALFLGGVSVAFNVLTVRSGERRIATIPDWVPVIAGPITMNAVVFGLLAATGVIGLVLVWATVGSHISWGQLTRILPEPVMGFAVAGSTAINLVPQTAAAIADIREATAARGYSASKARQAVVLLTPVVNGGLDRSMQLAEVLEARGFGGRGRLDGAHKGWIVMGWNALLAGAFIGSYGFIGGIDWAALAGISIAVAGGIMLACFQNRNAVRRSRFREERLGRSDWISISVSIAVIAGCLSARSLEPDAFRYEPYPRLTMPSVSVAAMLPLFGLFAVSLFAQVGPRNRA